MRVVAVLLTVLALTTALPATSKYRVYKNPRSKVATVEEATVPVHVTSGDAAAVLPLTTTTTEGPPQEVTTEKSKSSNTPVGEPTKVPSSQPTPSAVVLPETVQPPTAEEVPSKDSPAVAVPAAGAAEPTPAPVSTVTVVPIPPNDRVNVTGPGPDEDDSSSEEDNEDEKDEKRRRKLPQRNPKSVKFPFRANALTKKAVNPKNPPLKYDLVINGFVTEDGQVLVPFDTYQKYFHDDESKQLPPIYAISRDEIQTPSTSAVVSEETESEEVKGQDGVKSNKDADSAETVVGSSEETTGNSDEKPSSNEVAQPLVSEEVPRFRPPLQVLPARFPTGEDDEEDAGRYLDHPQLDYLPEVDYDDDFGFHHTDEPEDLIGGML